MADVEWLKALATANLGPQGVTIQDPDSIYRLTQSRIQDALYALRDEAILASNIHNDHARHERAIRILPLSEKSGGAFIMLCGRAQLTLIRDRSKEDTFELTATLVVMQGFIQETLLQRRFVPCSDPFGSVMWMQDNSLLMNHELIIKRLLEDLFRAAC